MTQRIPKRESTSRRREESRAQLLLAAEAQLREEELEAFSVHAVVERAHESVGTFYRIFSGKQELLSAVQNRLHDRIQPTILKALDAEKNAHESLEEAVEHAFGVIIEQVLSERELSRAFVLFSTLDPVLREKSRQQNLERRDALTSVLEAHRDEIRHPDPDEAIHHAYHLYLATMTGRLVLLRPGLGPVFGVSNDVFFAQLKLSIRNFLLGVESSPSSPPQPRAPS